MEWYFIDALLISTDESFKAAAFLYDVLSDPDYGPSYAPHKAPVTKVYNFPDEMTMFTWFHENVCMNSVANFSVSSLSV